MKFALFIFVRLSHVASVGLACALLCPLLRAEGMADLLDRQIVEIRAESTEATLSNLDRACTQCWLGRTPGMDGFVSQIPLHSSFGAGEIFGVYRERRFLKLLEEFQAVEPARAGEILSAELAEALREYSALFEEMVRIQGALDPGPGADRTPNGPVFILDPDPGLEPTLLGARHKVFAILTLIGVLRPPGVRAAVAEAVHAAVEQRNWCYENKELSAGFRISAMDMAGIYNRQILGAALLATAPEADRIMAKLENRAVRWTESGPIMRFDELTPDDPSAASGFRRAPSALSLPTFPILEPLGDAQFDLLCELAEANPAK